MERDENAMKRVGGLPRCLHIPVAARDIGSIERFIGTVTNVYAHDRERRALLVEVGEPEEMDDGLIIWDMPGSEVLHRSPQLWVHIDYRAYRRAYQTAFPDENIDGLVMDHVENRRSAQIRGFNYVRVVPITRAANSSSGGLSEKMGVEHHRKPATQAWLAAHPCHIRYADDVDLLKMMNFTQGNRLHDAVNDFQRRLSEERRR